MSQHQHQQHVETITNHTLILALLVRLKSSKNALTIMFPDIDSPFLTNIIDINKEDSTFSLDELASREGHRLLVSGKKFLVFGHIKGVSTRFSSQVISTLKQGDYLDYICQLPESISTSEKRDSHRIHLSMILRPSIIISSDEKSLVGRVVDVSLGGIGIVVRGKPKLEVGLEVDSCAISLPDNAGVINARVRTCYIQEVKKKDEWKLGFELLDLPRQHRKIWRNWVMNSERKQLRTLTAR